jgi:hypothetical protein
MGHVELAGEAAIGHSVPDEAEPTVPDTPPCARAITTKIIKLKIINI